MGGMTDGCASLRKSDDESIWAIVICLAQYHLDVLCRRNALESQINLLNQEMTMAIVEGQPLSAYPYMLSCAFGIAILAASVVAIIAIVLAYNRVQSLNMRLIE